MVKSLYGRNQKEDTRKEKRELSSVSWQVETTSQDDPQFLKSSFS